MVERNISIVELSKALGIDPSIIRRTLNKVHDVKLKTLIALSDYFECTLDFLCGKSLDDTRVSAKVALPFGESLKTVMQEYNVKPLQLIKDTKINPSKYYYWLNGGEPMLTSLNMLAEYLGITLDELIGRK